MSSADTAIAHIDQTELVNFALTICNIDSAGPTEAEVALRSPIRDSHT
jgi:hypothetical protein